MKNAWVALSSLLAIACSSKHERVTAFVGDAGAPVVAVDAGPVATREQLVRFRDYADALARGRRALSKKDEGSAISAFDDALALWPDDPARALHERSAARLLMNLPEGALVDLEEARSECLNRGLEADVMFELGRARKLLGDAEGARAAFRRVQRLKPSTLAAQEIMGKSECDAEVRTDPSDGVAYADWLSAWRALASKRAGGRDGLDIVPVTNEDDAKRALCGGECGGAGPFVIRVSSSLGADLALAFPKGAGLRVFAGLGKARAGICAGEDTVTFVPGPPLKVHVVSDPRTYVFVRAHHEGTEPTVCEDSIAGCVAWCEPATWAERDWYFDAKGRRVLAIEEVGHGMFEGQHPRTVGAVIRGDTLELRGPACTGTVSWQTK